jgi:peptidoglycan hydrolase-like protein with peptidoglycan-binding domain
MQASTQATTSLPACSTLPILRRNDQQKSPIENVRLLQKRLNTFHGIKVNVDGFFGAKTEAAVKEYQERISDHDLSFVVDGIVGPKTWQALGMCVKG